MQTSLYCKPVYTKAVHRVKRSPAGVGPYCFCAFCRER